MRFIVNNEKERELIIKFIKVMNDYGFDAIEEFDKRYCPDEDPSFWYHERFGLESGFGWSRIVVDHEVREIYFDDDELITGTCVKCGCHTTGTQDGEVTYADYFDYISDERQKTWLCEDCFNKGCAEELG